MTPACRVAFFGVRFADRAAGFEGLGNLFIEFDAIGHDNESPVARNFAQELLRVEHHGQTFPAALRLPEHAAASVTLLAGFQRCSDRVVYSEKLMILTENLQCPG